MNAYSPFVLAVLTAAQPILPERIPAAEALLQGDLPPTLDAKVRFAYVTARSEPHPEGDLHPLLGRSVTPQGIKMTARFETDIGERELGRLAEVGCETVRLDNGAVAVVGPVAEMWCTWDALRPLAALPGLVRASPTLGYRLHRPAPPPHNTTAHDVEITALRAAHHFTGGRGEGVVVADIDSGFDPFHPFLFRADGGFFEWIDVDGNGAFDPLVDAVDFDRNGMADEGEALGMLKAPVYSFYTSATPYNADGPFVAGVDFLFQDENGDGVRNFGPNPPWGESKPTYGEQLFVADDVDGDGVLDVNERVVALKTHKVKAALSPLTPGGTLTTFRRGINLSRITWPYPGDEMHGTMVMGTIAGGDPRYTRYAGMAPDAELVLASSRADELVSTLAWAHAESASIVLWEMATWYGEFLDGSSNLEVACDAAMDQGMLQIGAAGNLGGSLKHRVKTHAPGTEQVPLIIPGGQAQWVLGNFLWRGAPGALAFSITVNGATVQLSGPGGQTQVGTAMLQWYRDVSPRGTAMLLFYVASGSTLPGQTATFSITNSGEGPVELHGYVTDSFTSWNRGVYWPVTTGGTDSGTYGTPGTGDKTLAIGTSFLDFVPPGEVSGALASHSGQGPRIDGLDSVDLIAPEDHVTSASGLGGPFGSMMVGGGTSNASPMVTGIAAVLRALHPSDSAFQLRDRLFDHAHVEPQMGAVPNDRWGHGKARAYRAHFAGALPPANTPPVAAGTAFQREDGTLVLDAGESSDPDGDALRYRWDVDYDGVWDLGPMDAPDAQALLPNARPKFVKLEVIDAKGGSARVLVPVIDEAQQPADGGTTHPGWDGGMPDAGIGGGGVVFLPAIPDGKSRVEGGAGCGCTAGAAAMWPAWMLALGLAVRRRRRR